MEELEKIVYINELYDLYKDLLTDKQRDYFEKVYFDNYSLSETAEIYKVSRNAVHLQVNSVKADLIEYENKLHLREKGIKSSVIIEKIRSKSNEEVSVLLDELMEVL